MSSVFKLLKFDLERANLVHPQVVLVLLLLLVVYLYQRFLEIVRFRCPSLGLLRLFQLGLMKLASLFLLIKGLTSLYLRSFDICGYL